MNFSEKLKNRRKELKMTQKDLAEAIGTTSRSIINYEKGKRQPQNIEIVQDLAKALDVTVEYLMTERDEFLMTAENEYGKKGKRDAENILENAAALFAGGELDDDEMMMFMTRIQTIYLDSKKKAKKYANK